MLKKWLKLTSMVVMFPLLSLAADQCSTTLGLGPFPGISMNPYFIGETSPDFHPEHPRGYVTRYLKPEERANYEVSFKGNQILAADGKVIADPGHVFNYVMDLEGNFYLFDQTVDPAIRHSSIFAGDAVACAGEMIFEGDHLQQINNNSGHYHPSAAALQEAVGALKDHGLDITTVKVVKGPFVTRGNSSLLRLR